MASLTNSKDQGLNCAVFYRAVPWVALGLVEQAPGVLSTSNSHLADPVLPHR